MLRVKKTFPIAFLLFDEQAELVQGQWDDQ